jgi:glycosyltransferase A (GT-A) superfamily protein (DUF2064 family)
MTRPSIRPKTAATPCSACAAFDPSLFAGIGWSGPQVAADTIARVQALGWSLWTGETLRDVDDPSDLDLVEHLL